MNMTFNYSIEAACTRLFTKGCKTEPIEGLCNKIIIDRYYDLLPEYPFKEIEEFLQTKEFVFDKIKSRHKARPLFDSSSILLVYWLTHAKSSQLKDIWPLNRDDLALVFSDLGKRFDY